MVADEDAEAIANVEKLTGAKVKVFGKEDVRVELADAGSEPEAKSRSKPKSKRENEDEDAPREERPAKPRRERNAGGDKPERKPRSRRSDHQDDEPVAAGEWNGPKPGFLDVGFKG